MFTRRSKVLGARLALQDLVVTAISFELAYVGRQHLSDYLRDFYFERGMFVLLLGSSLAIWWAAAAGLGLYRRPELQDPMRLFRDTLRQTVVATGILIGWIYLLKLGEISRLFLLMFAAINGALLLLFRMSAQRLRLLRKGDRNATHFVIVGTGDQAMEVARLIETNEALGYRVLAFVRERRQLTAASGAPEGLAAAASTEVVTLGRGYPVHDLERLPRMLEEHVVDEIIFALSRQDLEQMEEVFLACEEEGVRVRVVMSFFPHVASEISLERLRDLPLLTFSTTPESEYLLLVKRMLDFTLAAAALVVVSPLLILIAAAIKVSSAGPVIYSQVRCGLNGRRFRLYKFRSMYRDADERRAEVAHLNEMDGPVFKSARDPRVTPVGRFLRKFSLDEWPQLVNILKGDMSFVGPRPPLPEEVQQYQRWQRRRLRMKPGITCLWALEGRNKLDFSSWMKLDLHYIDHWSLLLDLKILLRTIPHVLSGKGM